MPPPVSFAAVDAALAQIASGLAESVAALIAIRNLLGVFKLLVAGTAASTLG